MRFLLKIRDNLPALGLCWLLFLCLISAFPVETLPNQVDQGLDTKRHLLARAEVAPELEKWEIYRKYKERAVHASNIRQSLRLIASGKELTADEKKFIASEKKLIASEQKLIASEQKLIDKTSKATRQPDPTHRGRKRYIFGKQSGTVKDKILSWGTRGKQSVPQSVTVNDKLLGTGATGKVYEGALNPSRERVAVKESPRPNLLRAGAFMVALKDNKNVIEQLGIFKGESVTPDKMGNHRETFFQITPVMDESLSDWLKRIGHDDWQRYQLPIAEKALGGLVSMHSKGIAHRDYKPSNILLRKMENGELQVFIADLDAATDKAVSSEVRTGTKGYTSLEYMIGPEYDTKLGDVPAAAMAMLELLFYQVSRSLKPTVWRWTLWMEILNAQTPTSEWPNSNHETSAARIKRKILLNDDFAGLLPGMTKDLAEVLSRAFCLEKERDTSEKFMKSFLPLLPFEPPVEHDGC